MTSYEPKYSKQIKGSTAARVFSGFVRMVAGAVIVVSGIGIVALLIAMMWNTVAPTVFGLPYITYWQAYLFYLLTYLLFFHQ